jgi:ubiquinone/menaquinone biosynthesis C-methylase UbiE
MPGHPLFAAVYDRMAAVGEKAGMRELRAELLAGARGRTLELGAGTGLNLGHYGEAVTELVLTEPDPHMAKRLRRRISESPPPFPARVIEAEAEQLPFEDASFDTVVSTLVFCTVSDPEQAAGEAARVVKPDGELLLVERTRRGRVDARPLARSPRTALGVVHRGLPSKPRHRNHPERTLRRLRA